MSFPEVRWAVYRGLVTDDELQKQSQLGDPPMALTGGVVNYKLPLYKVINRCDNKKNPSQP